MSIALPKCCSNPLCRGRDFKAIHRFARAVAINAVNGPSVFAHHITYRCDECGQTWAVQGEATRCESEGSPGLMARESAYASVTMSRGW